MLAHNSTPTAIFKVKWKPNSGFKVDLTMGNNTNVLSSKLVKISLDSLTIILPITAQVFHVKHRQL
jgi:hypothetical protein